MDKELLKKCLRDQRTMIENADIIARNYDFEENGNYVLVGVRHSGKSYLLYQKIQQLLHRGHGWDEILFVNFDEFAAFVRAGKYKEAKQILHDYPFVADEFPRFARITRAGWLVFQFYHLHRKLKTL